MAQAKVKEISIDSGLATEYHIDEITKEILRLKEGESLFVNGHEILYTDGTCHVGTSYGDLVFDNADAASRFCVRAGYPQGISKPIDVTEPPAVDKIEQKLIDLGQRAKRLEAKIAPATRAMRMPHYHIYYKTYSGRLETMGRYYDEDEAEEAAERFRESTKLGHDTSIKLRTIQVRECNCLS